jgi:hypothetical protein
VALVRNRTLSLGLVVLGIASSLGYACGSDPPSSAAASAGLGGAGPGGTGQGGAGPGGTGQGGAGQGGGGQGGAGQGGAGQGGGGSLFQPKPGTTWQWQLSDLPLDTSIDVAVYDVDLFETTDQEFITLHADGRVVICYFSAGSWEMYRPDADKFPDDVKGDPLDPPFADEVWLDIRSPVVRGLMQARLDLAATRGCDAVEPDNVDGYANSNGLALTASDQVDYNKFIAAEAHKRGLSVGLKNDLDQLAELVGDFDWALNEECFSYNECDVYTDTFIAAGKAVFHAEYVNEGQLGAVCAVTKPLGLSTIIKNIELDAYRVPCP